MVVSRRRCLLEVERLENRLTPAACVVDQSLLADLSSDTTDDTTTIVADAPSDPAPLITPIDPTGDPVNSTNTTVAATVTGVETPNSSGLAFSITVSGLTPQNVQAFSTLNFTVPSGTTYTVDAAFQQENGDYALVVLAGVDTTGLDVGSTLVITIGNGGEILSTPPPSDTPPADPSEPPPAIPPIDPTDDPTGVSVTDSTDTFTTTESADTTSDTMTEPDSMLPVA